MNPLYFCNKNGIPCLETQGVSLTTTACTYTLKNHPFLNANYQGFVVIKIAQSVTAPTTAVPIIFTTLGTSVSTPVMERGGVASNTSTINDTGVYLFFYDRTTDTLQLVA